MKNKLQTIAAFLIAVLILFMSCDNYLVNGGIREYVDGLGSSNFTITFDANGNGAEVLGSMEAQTVTKGVPVALNANSFTRSGYGFVKWTTVSDGTGRAYADGDNITVTESITLYAQWAEELTITFEANGGTGEMPKQTVLSGVDTPINENTFVHSNRKFQFVGWNAAQDGNGTNYADKAFINVTEDTTLYAKWSDDFWKITFNGNGGTLDGKGEFYQYVEKTKSTTIPANTFAKTDATFAIWNDLQDGSGTDHEVGKSFTPINDSTLYAQWNYTVTFEVDGGSFVEEVQVREEKTFAKPADPTKEHLTFAGWYKEAEYTNRWDFDNDTVTEKTTLYAKWNATITFNANAGSDTVTGTMTAQTVNSGVATALTANTFERTGYTFTGWNTVKDGLDGTSYADGAQITITSNTELYAQWKLKPTITFDANTGKGEIKTQIFNADGTEEYLKLNEDYTMYTKEGHEFVGWHTEINGEDTGTPFADGGLITFTESKTLYAQWALSSNIYTITYDGNGGKVANNDGTDNPTGAESYTQFVERGSSAQLKPKTFTNGDTVFMGWTTAQDGSGTAYQNNEVVAAINSTQTLYAQWGYVVSFDTDGGSAVPAQTVMVNKTFNNTNLPATPFKEGYIFEDWYKEAKHTNKWIFASDEVKSDITLFAKWTKTEYTITFYANDGSSSTVEQKVVPLTPTALEENEFTNGDKLFIGWSIDPDGTEVDYADNAVISVNSGIALYAQWRDAITVSFNANGGSGNMNNLVVPSGIATKLTKNTFIHSNQNNTFTGWQDEDGKAYADEAEITVETNTTLYAQWASDVWVITFNGNDGSVPNTNPAVTEYTQNVKKETTANLQLNNFAREGYEFAGWNEQVNGTGTQYNNASQAPEKNVTLYAQWKKMVTITYNQNYGSNLAQTQAVLSGEPTKLQKNLFERPQHYFTGWSTESGNYSDEQENVTFNTDTTLYAQWTTAPYSDTLARTIISNGYNLKLTGDNTGSTVFWIYDNKEIALQDIHSANIRNGTDLSSYTIKNGTDTVTGEHILTGGSIRGVEGMDTLSIQGDLTIGSASVGGIVLTKDNQLTITGTLTGSDKGIIVRSHSFNQGTVLATVTGGGNPLSMLNITDKYGSLPVDAKYENDELIAVGQVGLTPSDRVEWEADGSFTIPEIVLGVPGTIFSLSVTDGYFTLGSETTIAGATFNMGIPLDKTGGAYVEKLNSNTSYTYIQFYPEGTAENDKIPAENVARFVQSLTFTPNDPTKEMGVKINLETVGLSGVNTKLTFIDHSKVTYFDGSYYRIDGFGESKYRRWSDAYDRAKGVTFNNLQGYLMTITSDAENNFIFDKVNVNVTTNPVPVPDPVIVYPNGRVRAWIGGTRLINSEENGGYDGSSWIPGPEDYNDWKDANEPQTDKWYWACGPEAGKTFYHQPKYDSSGEPTDSTVDINYNNWNNDFNDSEDDGVEPSDHSPGELVAHYLETSLWNDFPVGHFNNAPHYYFVEFSVYGSQKPTNAPAFAEQYYIKP